MMGGARCRLIERAEDIARLRCRRGGIRGDCAWAHGGEKKLGGEGFGLRSLQPRRSRRLCQKMASYRRFTLRGGCRR